MEILRRQLNKSGGPKGVHLEVWDPSMQREYLVKNNISCVKAERRRCVYLFWVRSATPDQAGWGHPLNRGPGDSSAGQGQGTRVCEAWLFIFPRGSVNQNC